MKVSVSLPEEDVEFLDHYAREHDVSSRSAALHRAIKLLRSSQLGHAYADAWREWDDSGSPDEWETVVGDGLAS